MALPETYLAQLARLAPYAEMWRDDKKFIELCAVLYATLYFEHAHPMAASEEHLRSALIECWHDYWNVVGLKNWRWVYRFTGDTLRLRFTKRDQSLKIQALLFPKNSHQKYFLIAITNHTFIWFSMDMNFCR